MGLSPKLNDYEQSALEKNLDVGFIKIRRRLNEVESGVETFWATLRSSVTRFKETNPQNHTGIQHGVIAAEVFESDGQIFVNVELPGLTADDVRVEIVGDTLTLFGQKNRSCKTCDQIVSYSEVAYGEFRRQIVLPCFVDTKDIQARLNRGVLFLELTKEKED